MRTKSNFINGFLIFLIFFIFIVAVVGPELSLEFSNEKQEKILQVIHKYKKKVTAFDGRLKLPINEYYIVVKYGNDKVTFKSTKIGYDEVRTGLRHKFIIYVSENTHRIKKIRVDLRKKEKVSLYYYIGGSEKYG